LGAGADITDGANNFQTQSPNHKRGAVLSTARKPEFVAQFKQEYFSHPVTEAGYAYDIFHLINHSAEVALRTHADFTNQTIAKNILAFESGTGLLGKFSLDKNGVSYKQETRTV
jgi:branched-chain amino acid transport system substrate-binding protein